MTIQHDDFSMSKSRKVFGKDYKFSFTKFINLILWEGIKYCRPKWQSEADKIMKKSQDLQDVSVLIEDDE